MPITVEASDSESNPAEGSDEKILNEAKARFKLAEEAWRDIRKHYKEDVEFRAGDQWPDAIKNARDLDNRPRLVINKIVQSIQQVTNDQRQNRPAIKVSPVDDKADIEIAKIRQGMIRHIEYSSNADVAYDRAFESAATGGFGFFGFTTAYCDEQSFDQEVRFRSFPNPLAVLLDPHSQEPDGSDANHAFVDDRMSPDEFRAQFPKAKLASAGTDWSALEEEMPDWFQRDSVRVVEYFYKEWVEKTLVQLSTGDSLFKEKLPGVLPEGVEIIQSRTVQIPVIRWCKINGNEILEKTAWAGKYIPIVPVYGNEVWIGNVRTLEGITRHSKDPQRMYNYWRSAETETIALAPKVPYIAAEGQLEGYENDWATANSRSHSVLVYKPTSVSGQLVPPPQRNTFEPAVSAITQASMLASEDLKATTGIYDASLGAQSNETSGIAIQRRNRQAQTSNFHFVDNLTRSMRHGGRILNDVIPKIYDTARVARIIGDDGEERIVRVNDPTFEENGKPTHYQLDVGKYDVTVNVGPSFASKREEAVASMLEVIKAYPPMAQVSSDLLVKNMDWPGAQEIAERLRKTLPPGIADNKGDQEIPPEVQAQLQQMGTMIDGLTEKLNLAHDERDQKILEMEHKERIEFKKLEVQLEIKKAELDAKDALAILNAEIAQIGQRLDLLKSNQPIEQDSQVPEPQGDGGMSAVSPEDSQPQPTGGSAPGTHMEGFEP